jgi:membrane carboxypeptidase/penicillin-binding protein
MTAIQIRPSLARVDRVSPQQLVKNLLLSPERTLKRKVSEAYMSVISGDAAFEAGDLCTLLQPGLPRQQSGFSINGFGEAASAYFNKDVTTLTLPESAFLAGLIRSPNRYNPRTDLETGAFASQPGARVDGRDRRDYRRTGATGRNH